MSEALLVSVLFNIMQFVVILALIGEARRSHDIIQRQQERIQDLMNNSWRQMDQGNSSAWLWILLVVGLVVALFFLRAQ